jgi:hypothetical protein
MSPWYQLQCNRKKMYYLCGPSRDFTVRTSEGIVSQWVKSLVESVYSGLLQYRRCESLQREDGIRGRGNLGNPEEGNGTVHCWKQLPSNGSECVNADISVILNSEVWSRAVSKCPNNSIAHLTPIYNTIQKESVRIWILITRAEAFRQAWQHFVCFLWGLNFSSASRHLH